jgi:Zn-dependent peptidase ImmA (M78 family)
MPFAAPLNAGVRLFQYLTGNENMNTTQKGDTLESKIFKLIKKEIAQGRFFVSLDRAKIFSKKGYYSRDREKDIVFDIAVEVYLPGQNTYSLLILIECKNYNHSVPVDDVEEFYQKVQQVAGANGKAIIVSTNSFQEGTLNFAKSKGIGLLRYYDKSKIKWELTRSPSALVSFSYAESEWMTAYKGITDNSYESRYFDCYCFSDGRYTNSLRAFFSRLLFVNIEEEIKKRLEKILTGIDDNRRLVAYREDSEIEEACENILKLIGYDSGEVSLVKICELLSAESKLNISFEEVNGSINKKGNVLGEIRFVPLEIKIYKIKDHTKEREKFTLAHELGHYLLAHSRYMKGEYVEEVDLDVENPAQLGVKDIMRMEWQANYFASCLLLPTSQFVADFFSVAESLGLRDRGFGALYVDDQPCNLNNFYKVTYILKMKYQVSRAVVKLRLKKLGLLNEPGSKRA